MDDFECDFDELDKLIAQEVTKDPLCDYESDEKIDAGSVLEGAYSKIAFYSETTWWDQEEVDEYRVNNLGLWSAVMGCDQCKWNQSIPVNEKLTDASENSPESKKKEETEDTDDEAGNWLKTTPWPASLLKLYPQIPDAVASKNVSIFSHFHSTFAGDLLYSKIRNVKELIQYNRLKQDCVKNLWNDNPPFEDLLNLNSEEPPEPKTKVPFEEVVCKEEKIIDDKLTTINEICDSFNAIIAQKSLPIIKGEIKNEKLEVKIKLLERRKTFYDFQKEFENAFNSLPPSLISSRDDFQHQGNQCKKLKTEKIENSYTRKNFCNKNKNNQTEVSKKSYKLSEKSSSLIKENFGSFPINQGEIIETLEEVCQWLHNVYPHKSRDDNLSIVSEQASSWSEKLSKESSQPSTELVPLRKKNGTNNQIKKILPRPTVSDFSCQMFSQIPSRRLYRDVLTNAEVQSCLDADPVNKFAELEREAIEQYSGCSINSETSIALLHMDEDSKFKDLEREAIEQYQPEEDSIITSGELFTPSELLKQSPISTPPKVNSSTQVNIYETQTESKKEKNCLSCQALRKSSSEYLLCSDTWPEGIDNIFAETNVIKFENSKISQKETVSNRKYLKSELEIDTPIRILKPPRSKESTPIVDIYEPVSTLKTLTYTSPYDSPTEEFQPEECSSKIVKFILKKNHQELSEEDNFKDSFEKEKIQDNLETEESKTIDEKNQESSSKVRESDEEKSGQDDSKKKKKKKKRSRKKKGCKKDGGGGGGGGGGGNGRGGGGRCDARTPIHCPIPLTNKTSESKIKKKEESSRKDKKGDVASNILPYKWLRLHNILTKLAKIDSSQKNIIADDLLYDEYYLEQLSLDETVNTSLPHNLIKRIPSYLFVSENEKQVSILIDLIYYRLQRWGWCYLSHKDLFSKCLNSCCFNKSEPFPSWLKWCKCFTLRVGQCHMICPGSIFIPDLWRIPKAEVFNPKYWELSGGGMLQGIIISLSKNVSVHSVIYSVMNMTYQTQMTKYQEGGNNFSINQYKYIYEVTSQKIYHVCNNSHLSVQSEVHSTQKKSNARNRFHRGKNNKIKGKTFCYYCSGNSFKNYTLHTFFCEVDAQNKGIVIDRDKIIAQPVKKAWGNASTSSKYQQTEKDTPMMQDDYNSNDILLNDLSLDETNTCINKGCYKCQTSFTDEYNNLKKMGDGESNQIFIRTPVVSAKDVGSSELSYHFDRGACLTPSESFRLLEYSHEDPLTELKNLKKLAQSDNSIFQSSFDISKTNAESSTNSLEYLYDRPVHSEYFNKDFSNISFDGFSYSRFKKMKRIEESWRSDFSRRNEQVSSSDNFSDAIDIKNGLSDLNDSQFNETSDYVNEGEEY